MRRALQAALPRAPPPEAQTVREPALLHTTLARLVQPPAPGSGQLPGGGRGRLLRTPVTGDAAAALLAAVRRASDALCGLRATLPNLWCAGFCSILRLPLVAVGPPALVACLPRCQPLAH